MIFLHTFIIVIVIYFLHLVYCVIPNKNALKKWLWLQLVEWFFFHYSFSKGMVCCKNCKHSVFCIDWWLVIMLHRTWHTKITPLVFYQKKKIFFFLYAYLCTEFFTDPNVEGFWIWGTYFYVLPSSGILFWTACITHNMNIYSPNYENYAIYRVYYLALEQCFARTELLWINLWLGHFTRRSIDCMIISLVGTRTIVG